MLSDLSAAFMQALTRRSTGISGGCDGSDDDDDIYDDSFSVRKIE